MAANPRDLPAVVRLASGCIMGYFLFQRDKVQQVADDAMLIDREPESEFALLRYKYIEKGTDLNVEELSSLDRAHLLTTLTGYALQAEKTNKPPGTHPKETFECIFKDQKQYYYECEMRSEFAARWSGYVYFQNGGTVGNPVKLTDSLYNITLSVVKR